MTASSKNSLVRHATAQWRGTPARGEGRLSTDSQALAGARYSFPTRFAQEIGTNPEELIAAAHAGCYSMALAHLLEQEGAPPEHIETTAALTLEMSAAGPNVTGIRLQVQARVPGVDDAAFAAIAARAKDACLVSRLLKTAVTLEVLRLGEAPAPG